MAWPVPVRKRPNPGRSRCGTTRARRGSSEAPAGRRVRGLVIADIDRPLRVVETATRPRTTCRGRRSRISWPRRGRSTFCEWKGGRATWMSSWASGWPGGAAWTYRPEPASPSRNAIAWRLPGLVDVATLDGERFGRSPAGTTAAGSPRRSSGRSRANQAPGAGAGGRRGSRPGGYPPGGGATVPLSPATGVAFEAWPCSARCSPAERSPTRRARTVTPSRGGWERSRPRRRPGAPGGPTHRGGPR